MEQAVSIRHWDFGTSELGILYQRAGFMHKATEAWERAHSPDDATRAGIKNI